MATQEAEMDSGVFRDLSLVICLIPQTIVLLLVPLALTVGSCYGMYQLRLRVPAWLKKAQSIFALIAEYAEKGSALICAPLVAAYALAARLNAWKSFIQKELKQ
jgi:hypothetical protein